MYVLSHFLELPSVTSACVTIMQQWRAQPIGSSINALNNASVFGNHFYKIICFEL